MADSIDQAYADYLRSQGKSDEEIRDQIAFEKYQAGEFQPDDSTWYGDLGRGALEVLDYTSNLGRGAVGGLYQKLSGKNLGINFKDVIAGNTPDTAELLRRGEVPEMDFAPNVSWIPSGRTMIGFAGDVLADPVTYIPFVGQAKAAATLAKTASKVGKAGQVAQKAGRIATRGLGDLVEKGGDKLWKSGFKRIDSEVMKYGKEPVSDVLVKYGVTGTQDQVYNQMDELGKRLLKERQEILRDATRKGAEVDVARSMKPARDFIADLRRINDPTVVDSIVPKFEGVVDDYMTRAAREPEMVLRELPVGAQYGDDFVPVPRKARVVLDETERVMGPTPLQTSQWKSTGYGRAGDQAYREAVTTPQGIQFQKVLNRGLKEATEESVGRAAGREAQERLVQANDELGRILTSKDRQLRDAAAAANKDFFTSVDGILIANPGMLAGKKAADALKTTYIKTKAGKAMKKAGKKAPEAFWRQLLLQPTDRTGLEE